MIKPESLLFQILENNKEVYQFYLQIRVSVYDPEEFVPLDEDVEETWIPFEIVDKSYLQKVVWVRDEYFIIETTDLAGNPLHITYWEFGGKEILRNLQSSRLFQPIDVEMPYLIFFTKHLPSLKLNLSKFGISPFRVKLEQQQNKNYYSLGIGGEKLLVDQDTYHVVAMHSQIQIWGKDYLMIAKFSNWDSVKERIPLTTQLFVNGRLFKEAQVNEIKFGGIRSKAQPLLKSYNRLFSADLDFDLDTKYGK